MFIAIGGKLTKTTQGALAILTSYPCTKFVVPSTGSMIHVGLSVKMHGSPFATDSSPMKLQRTITDGPISQIWQGNVVPRLQTEQAHKDCTPMCVWVNVSPVRAFPELLLKRPDDDLLHPLIGLGDEVHSGALRADLYFLLPGFPDDLNERNIKSTCLRFWG